eukprot:Clim_evm20s214 gene=Clim_evmTU20s214
MIGMHGMRSLGLGARFVRRQVSPGGGYLLQHRDLHRICIVGSGPAGFYTAHRLMKAGRDDLEVDILERLPLPYGLVRFGVAPDHPEVKNCIHTFETAMETGKIHFYGNIAVGDDVTVDELTQFYSGVVFAHGAAGDRHLNVPGEHLKNVIGAKDFVGWYNGHPDNRHLEINLDLVKPSGSDGPESNTAVIFGQGNVALDVARILSSPQDLLRDTDISSAAFEQLASSSIQRVLIVGRRGPMEIAATIKEVREQINLPDCKTIIRAEDVRDQVTPEELKALPRPRKRLTELLLKHTADHATAEGYLNDLSPRSKVCEFRFLRSPLEIIGDETTGQVRGVRMSVNELVADPVTKKVKAKATDGIEEIPCGLVIRSIGYRSHKLEGLPFDEKAAIVPNEHGRVSYGNKDQGFHNVYVTGWAKRGPQGVILSTMNDAFETASAILDDLDAGKLKEVDEEVPPPLHNMDKAVSFEDWSRLDKYEIEVGQQMGKSREKMNDVPAILRFMYESRDAASEP